MAPNEKSASARATIVDAVATGLLVGGMMLAATVVALVAGVILRASDWPWFVWLIAAPFLYVCWLCSYFLLTALVCREFGRRHPKPRFKIMSAGSRRIAKDDLGMVTTTICYRQFAIGSSLPLSQILSTTSLFGPLIYRAYAPSVHFGPGALNMGVLYDPDLTELGANVVVGGMASIAAHSMAIRPGGEMVYVSAPVKIGDRATIGGEARVALGCVIGADAIVEPGSVVSAFTHIPAGEVWGGNPARFLRNRDDLDVADAVGAALDDSDQARAAVQSSRIPAATGNHRGTSIQPATPRIDDLRELVIGALDLSADGAPDEFSSRTCPEWDSLGQLAIAAAIFDRYGVAVDEEEVYRIRTLDDVATIVGGGALAADGRETAQPGAGPLDALSAATIPCANDALPDDLEMLPLLDPGDATRALAERFSTPLLDGQHLDVVIAASFTAQPISNALKLWGRAFGFELGCRFADYGQVVQSLLDERGLFTANHGGINVVLVRPEDLAAESEEETTAQVDQLLGAVRHFAFLKERGALLVGTLPPLVSSLATIDRGMAESVRRRWRSGLEATPGVEIFDFSLIVERVGIEAARDSGAEIHSRAPYSAKLYQELGIALAREVRCQRRSPAKVIAVDCDNTLWGGVVGEDGIDGLLIGADGPGRSFQLLQRRLKQLKERGILLAIVSRNEERDVLEVFEHHPEMVLRPDDIAAWSVNWNHKSENLRELADEMNLGVDSFVFVDDDPAVRLEVQTRLPEVHVVPLPEDHTEWCAALDRLWLFDGAQATAVDAARTRMMQEESRRKRELRTATSLDDYLAGLQLRVAMGPPTEHEWARVAQLTQRTNQFNLSLKRRSLDEVRALASTMSVLALKAADRFGDYGLVGVAIVRPSDETGFAEIDTLLMSCRALGRGVEDSFLFGIAEVAARTGAHTLLAPYVAGPRNAMTIEYLVRVGFQESEPGRWTRSIEALPHLPKHVEFDRPETVVVSPSPI